MDKQLKRKYDTYTLCILFGIAMLVFAGFEIAHVIHQNKVRQHEEWLKAQHNMRIEQLQYKLNYLQEKYAKEIEETKRVESINVYNLNYEDINLLAMNNYYESRGVGKTILEKRKDMENVTSVVLNRVQSGKYGKTVRDVIQGSRTKNGKLVCQFSWVCDENRPKIVDSLEWRLAYEVAFEIYSGMQKRSVYRAMHYYNPKKAKPRWAKKAKEVAYVYSGHRVIIVD